MKTAHIYKITNNKTDDIYIGSTIQSLKARFKNHKSNAKLDKKSLLYDCIRKNGIENFNILLLEEFKAKNKEEIGLKEKEYFYKLLPSLNMKIPNVVKIKEHGKIYKLFCKLDTSKFYIGSSTKDIKKRLSDHKSASVKGLTPLYTYMKEQGKENFYIELLEDKIEIVNLVSREEYWMQQLKPPLNKNIFLTRTEKERDKAKYEKNKETRK